MSFNYKVKPVKQDPLPVPDKLQKIIDAYDQAGLIYIRDALDDQEVAFLDLVTRRPDTHKRYVTSIYRLKSQKRFVAGGVSDEVLIYHMTEEVMNHMDMYVQLDRERGYWWKKNTRMTRNAQGQPAVPQVLGDIPVFEIPFSAEAVDKIIDMSLVDVNQFHVGLAATAGPYIMSGDPSTIKNKEDFKNGTHQELMDMARYNYSTNEPRLNDWRAEGEMIKKQSRTVTSLTSGSGGGLSRPGNRNA